MANYLIIGASSGIGKGVSEKLSESGHQVYGTFHRNQVQSESKSIQLFPLNVIDGSISLDFLSGSLTGVVYCPGSINLRPVERICDAQS